MFVIGSIQCLVSIKNTKHICLRSIIVLRLTLRYFFKTLSVEFNFRFHIIRTQ